MADLVVENDVMVPMRDGVRLRTDVFRPAEPGRYPVLVQRYPYSPRNGTMALFGQVIARQGYVVAVQSCRGRYGSEGDFYPFQPDVEDSYDTVEWAAAQPWSNGKVGMYGVSYSGLTSWAGAIARPPHLVAIAPLSCPWHLGESGWYAAPGVLNLGLTLGWSAEMTVWEAERRDMAPPLPALAEAEELMDTADLADPETWTTLAKLENDATSPLFDRRPLRDVEELRELAPWFRDWCDRDDPRDPYWRPISAAHHYHDIDLPILHTTGWYDFFAKGGIDAYTTMARRGATERTRKGQRLVVGPWNHSSMQVRPDADPDVEMIIDVRPGSSFMRFFDHHLKGASPGYADEPPVRIFVMGDNAWREEHEWPLARTRWTPHYLHGAHGLSTEPPGDEQPDVYVYDPADPVPGALRTGGTHGDPVDLEEIAQRPDVLVYTTEPLATDTEITGPVKLELWASSSVANTDFTAKLIEVFPDGSAIPLCQGVIRTGARTPNAVYCHEIDLWSTSTVVKAGHRIRLDVSSSEFPTYDLNPNTGERITHDPTGATVPATQHVFHDELHPSRLILPIIPR